MTDTGPLPNLDSPTPAGSRSGLPAAAVAWAALGAALLHLALTMAGDRAAAGGALLFLRSLLACLLLGVAGLPVALALLRRESRQRGEEAVGVMALTLLSVGASLVLYYLVSVGVRLVRPPVTGLPLSLTAVAGAAAALLLLWRWGRLRLSAEPGLSRGPVLLGLALVVAFSVVGRHRLFGGVQRFIIMDEKDREAAGEAEFDASRVQVRLVAGVVPDGKLRHRMEQDSALVIVRNSGEEALRSRFAMVFSAAPGTGLTLWAVPAETCDLPAGEVVKERRLASATVPEQVLEIEVAPVQDRFNGLLLAALDLPPGESCFELRLSPIKSGAGRAGATLVDVSGQDLSGWDLFGGRMTFVAPGTAECHLSDARYRAEMRTSNEISPQLLLWGYFTQFAAELLSGARDPMLGLLFLTLSFLGFCASLTLISAAAGAADLRGRIGARAGYLLLGPFLSHLHSLAFIDTYSFAFPDTAFTFLVLGALASLLLRSRAGFIVLGCLAAYARYPGAYIMAVALIGHLVLFREHRPWTRRTLLWALAAAALVIGALLAHFALTSGVRGLLQGLYFEIFPEHFEVSDDVAPFWQRGLLFLHKLSSYAGYTLLLWPLIRHPAGKLLVAVTVAYTLPLIGVHVAHSHYFPVLVYCAAAAGLGALARRDRWWLLAGAALAVAAGTAVGFTIDW